jgi:hypothetical protein
MKVHNLLLQKCFGLEGISRLLKAALYITWSRSPRTTHQGTIGGGYSEVKMTASLFYLLFIISFCLF